MGRFLEACCTSASAAAQAEMGGASRIELCEQLAIGGVTPSRALIEDTLNSCMRAKVNVLVRPRGGNFVFSEEEVQSMLDDIRMCREEGVNGVVIGALREDGSVDMETMKRLISAARPLSVTFHRAFDECCDVEKCLEDIISLGCDRLLTSGHEADAFTGRFTIAGLVKQAAGRIVIMAGCGVRTHNIAELEAATGAPEFHSSCWADMSELVNNSL